jgi:hypothetical protein
MWIQIDGGVEGKLRDELIDDFNCKKGFFAIFITELIYL